jgi:hypothetical protein
MKYRRPENEIVRLSVPELRIVDADLEAAVNKRLQNLRPEDLWPHKRNIPGLSSTNR